MRFRKLILALLMCAPIFSQDWKQPAYWGLKKGDYIPGPGCWTGSTKHKKFAYEVCMTIRYL